ncbi:MAG: Na-translocating system protein MpsC family protein [Solirubrobacterales bacterium]
MVFDVGRRDGKEDTVESQQPHTADAERMREPGGDGPGSLRADISTAIVGLYKRHYGKGPTHCRTYLEPDLVIVVLGEGYTPGEQTMFEAGKWHEVRDARQVWQDSMEGRFGGTIEELTGRKVAAFLSANRQDPDFAVELFVLEPEDD